MRYITLDSADTFFLTRVLATVHALILKLIVKLKYGRKMVYCFYPDLLKIEFLDTFFCYIVPVSDM